MTSMMTKRFARIAAMAGALLAIGACDEDADPVSPVNEVGTVAGLVFFDRDNNGAFTPTAGDSALANVVVKIKLRGTDSTIAEVTTDENGRWSSEVPVGTHDIEVVRDAALIAAQYVWCGARASVYRNEQSFQPTPVKFGCVVRINVAKPQPVGTTVTISGIVMAQPGRYRNDNLYLQDPTGGIQVFGVPAALGILEGDSIEVTGEIGVFSQQVQIVSPRIAQNIKRGVALYPALQRTTGQLGEINSPLAADVGKLVVVRKVSLTNIPTGTAAGNATMNDGSGAAQMRLDGNAATSIGWTTFVSGRCYDITGILGFFNGAIQLQPRTSADVSEVSCN
jgi:hypothetical protein